MSTPDYDMALVHRYAQALLDVFVLLPPDRLHLIRPQSNEMIEKARHDGRPPVADADFCAHRSESLSNELDDQDF
jgi:hypothetical protein